MTPDPLNGLSLEQMLAAHGPGADAGASAQPFTPTTVVDEGNPFIGHVQPWPAALQIGPMQSNVPGDTTRYLLLSIRYGMVSVPIPMTAAQMSEWGKAMINAASGLVLP